MKIKFEHRKKEHWIESDEHQYIVHEGFKEAIKKDGSIIKTRIKPRYFGMLKHAILFLLDKGIKNSDAGTLRELMKDYAELKGLLLKAFDFDYEIEE